MEFYRFTQRVYMYEGTNEVNDMAYKGDDFSDHILTRFGNYSLKNGYLEKVEFRTGLRFKITYVGNNYPGWEEINDYKGQIVVALRVCDDPGLNGNVYVTPSDGYTLIVAIYNLSLEPEIRGKCVCDIMDLMRVGCRCGGC